MKRPKLTQTNTFVKNITCLINHYFRLSNQSSTQSIIQLCLFVESQIAEVINLIIEVSTKVRDSHSQRGGGHARATGAGVRRSGLRAGAASRTRVPPASLPQSPRLPRVHAVLPLRHRPMEMLHWFL